MGIWRHSQHHSSIPSGFSGRHETRVAGLTPEEVQLARVRLDLRGRRGPRTAAFGTEGSRGGCRWQIGHSGRIDRTLMRGSTSIRTLTAVGKPFIGKGHGRVQEQDPTQPARGGVSSLLRLIWRSGEELVRQRVGVLLEARLKRPKTLIHILFQRSRVADERTDERQNHHGHDGGEDPAHGFIGHRFGGFGCTKNPPTFVSRQGRICR